jgi:hypothetical protein
MAGSEWWVSEGQRVGFPDPPRQTRSISEAKQSRVITATLFRVLTLEIEADLPDGAPDNTVRVVTENARTLKFKSQGFEEE